MDHRAWQTKSEPLTFTFGRTRLFEKGWAEKQDSRIAQCLTSLSRLSQSGLLIVSNQPMNGPHRFVYAARNTETGEVKIGRTKAPFCRLRSLSAMAPYAMERLLRVSKDNSVASERHIQWLLRGTNIRSEWFRASAAEVESAFMTVAHLAAPEKKKRVGSDKRFLTPLEMREMHNEGMAWADILRVAYCASVPFAIPINNRTTDERLRKQARLDVKCLRESGKRFVDIANICGVSVATIKRSQMEGGRMHSYILHRIVKRCAAARRAGSEAQAAISPAHREPTR